LVVAAGNRPEDASTIVKLIHNPLLARFKVLKTSESTVDEWANWMNDRYGDEWDKRTYAYNKKFEDEGHFLMIPSSPEGLENFANPRSWTWVALDGAEGFTSSEDLRGLLGEEVGQKYEAFLKLKIDLEDLLKNPDGFKEISFDGKYIVPILLATWTRKNIKDLNRAFPLIDKMSEEKHEFLLMLCLSLSRTVLAKFLKDLFVYKEAYEKVLSEVAFDVKRSIELPG